MFLLIICSLYLAVRVMFAVGVFLTYPVQFYVPMEVIMKFINSRCNETNRNSLLYEYLARFLMVSFTCMTYYDIFLCHFLHVQ